ncbi:DNA ligase 1-like [Pelobates cultripes]|uniref:DNA ligase 1-like n=1 Tax=Pelobates cultripes TaxID=61616 RepID=A0AAD1WAA8_PELCU|nr:DNA ligase 1-like [Pelobates cultripes]
MPGLLSVSNQGCHESRITIFRYSKDELVVKSPSRLLIPCRFYADEQVGTNQFLLEWGLTPENRDNYTPILRLYDTILEYMENGNSRAQVFVYLVQEGNCSLVINPTYTNDSGTYEIRLTINGVQHSPVPVIKVKVLGDKTVSLPEEIQSVNEEGERENTINEAESSEEKEAEDVVSVPLHATAEGGGSEKKSESFDCNSFAPQILLYAQILQKLEHEHKLKLLTYGVIVFGILLSIGSSIGVIIG